MSKSRRAESQGGRFGARSTRRRRAFARFDHGEPISKIDTRPISILAACLIAFTIPFHEVQPHETVISLWDGTANQPLSGKSLSEGMWEFDRNAIKNQITITQYDAIMWNGEMIEEATLLELLRESRTRNPMPVAVFEPEPDASYDLSAKVIYMLNYSGAPYQIAGMEDHCKFERSSGRFGKAGGVLNLAHSVTILSDDPLEFRGPLNHDACPSRIAVQRPR